MTVQLEIQVEGDSIEDAVNQSFPANIAAQMKSCSDLIAQMLDEREELDPENDEPIQILVSGQQFSGKEVKIAFNYLEHYKYCPPDYGKIISNVIKKNCRDDYDTALIMQYDLNNIKLLHSVASFFQIRSLTRLCYIRIGIEVYMNTNESGAVTKMCEKFAITETYTITTEQALKNQYPFLKNVHEKMI